MEDNPSIYINLAHTYIQTHGVRRRKRVFGDDAESEPETEERIANTRKAISLYQKAKELDPDDVSVAKLHLWLALGELFDLIWQVPGCLAKRVPRVSRCFKYQVGLDR